LLDDLDVGDSTRVQRVSNRAKRVDDLDQIVFTERMDVSGWVQECIELTRLAP
jgi:hypothetical protein